MPYYFYSKSGYLRNIRAARKSVTVRLTLNYDVVGFCGLFCSVWIFSRYSVFSSTQVTGQAIQCAVHSSWNCLTSSRTEMPSTATTKAIEYDKRKTSISDFGKHSWLGQQLSRNNAILDKIVHSLTAKVFTDQIYRKADIRILSKHYMIKWCSGFTRSF